MIEYVIVALLAPLLLARLLRPSVVLCEEIYSSTDGERKLIYREEDVCQ